MAQTGKWSLCSRELAELAGSSEAAGVGVTRCSHGLTSEVCASEAAALMPLVGGGLLV